MYVMDEEFNGSMHSECKAKTVNAFLSTTAGLLARCFEAGEQRQRSKTWEFENGSRLKREGVGVGVLELLGDDQSLDWTGLDC
jgi:hypothetical protein